MPMRRFLQMRMLPSQLLDHLLQVLALLALVLQHFRPLVALILGRLQVFATSLQITNHIYTTSVRGRCATEPADCCTYRDHCVGRNTKQRGPFADQLAATGAQILAALVLVQCAMQSGTVLANQLEACLQILQLRRELPYDGVHLFAGHGQCVRVVLLLVALHRMAKRMLVVVKAGLLHNH